MASIGALHQPNHGNKLQSNSFSPHNTKNKALVEGRTTGEIVEGGGGGGSHVPLSATEKPQKIPEIAKERIVELFATFHTHKQVHDIILEEYHIDISRHTLAIYDPERVACQLGKRLRRYYSETRKRYAEGASTTALAHQAHRLRKLEEIADKALLAKDFSSAIKALELAAKEMGGLLQAGNSKLTVEHRGTVGHVHATVQEARQEVALRLQGLLDTIPALQASLPAPEEEEGDSAAANYMDVQEEGDEGVVDGQAID